MKKHLSRILLSCLFALVALVASAASAYDCKVDGIYYNLNTTEKTATVTCERHEYAGDYQGVVHIPSEISYNGVTYAVTAIGNEAFYRCAELTAVTIPNSVTTIGLEVFELCPLLTEMTIPNSVTSIGSKAFYKCTNLTKVTIGSGVTYIGVSVFAMCPALNSVISLNATPPLLYTGAFDSTTTETATLHIPEGSKALYQQADIWKEFLNIQEDAPTGVETVKAGDGSGVCYDLRGNRVVAPKRGLNIVDGRKVVVK